MRLIISAKIPNKTETIHLDIVDDRSSSQVLQDIVLLAGLSQPDDPHLEYEMSLGEKKLDYKKTLAENGIENGDCLDITISQTSSSEPAIVREVAPIKTPPEPTTEKTDFPPVIGKKINFD